MTNSTLNTATFSAASSAGGTPIIGTVSVSGNTATLTPSARLAQNTSYTATITTAAKDAAGNALSAAFTWNFTTADTPKVWGAAQLLQLDNAASSSSPQIAFDGNGNAIAIWQHADRDSASIGANRFSAASGTWGAAQLIATVDAGDAWRPQLAVDRSGNAIAVWSQFNARRADRRSDIWANYFSAASGTWGTAQLIETDNAGDADAPQVAFDTNGNAIAVWHQSDGTRTGRNIWANRFSAANGTWGSAQMIETSNTSSRDPQIAFDASGNAIAVWEAGDVWANRFSAATGTWGTAQVIGNSAGFGGVHIALDANGNAMAVWSDSSAQNIWANRFSAASGTWGTAQVIENTGSALSPQVALDASGNAIAVWSQFAGFANPRYDIWANRFSAASGTWGMAQLIETGNGSASLPQVAFDPSGNAIAVWEQLKVMPEGTVCPILGCIEAMIPNIWFNRFSAASGTWGGAQLIETDGGGGAQIAFDTSGNAIVVWYGSDGMRFNIWARRFE